MLLNSCTKSAYISTVTLNFISPMCRSVKEACMVAQILFLKSCNLVFLIMRVPCMPRTNWSADFERYYPEYKTHSLLIAVDGTLFTSSFTPNRETAIFTIFIIPLGWPAQLFSPLIWPQRDRTKGCGSSTEVTDSLITHRGVFKSRHGLSKGVQLQTYNLANSLEWACANYMTN